MSGSSVLLSGPCCCRPFRGRLCWGNTAAPGSTPPFLSPPTPLFVPTTPRTLAGRWKPARCSVASGCRGLELSRTCGQRRAQQCPLPIPDPPPRPYLVRGLQADAARPRGLGLQLARERQHLQVGGRQAGEVPGALGELGDCGHGRGRGRPLSPRPRAAPPPPPALTRPHEVGPRAAELQLVGQRGQAAPRPPVPDLGQHLGHGVHALRHVLRADRGSSRPGGSPPPHPGALGPYLQRGAAQKRAGVGHDMRYPRHARPCPSPHPVAPRGVRRERRRGSTSGRCGQVRAGSHDGGAAAGSGNGAAAGEAGEGRAVWSGAVWRGVLAVASAGSCFVPFRSALPAASAGHQRGSLAGRPGAPAVGQARPGPRPGWGGAADLWGAAAAVALAEETAPGLNPEPGNSPCSWRRCWAGGFGRSYGTRRPWGLCEDPDPPGRRAEHGAAALPRRGGSRGHRVPLRCCAVR